MAKLHLHNNTLSPSLRDFKICLIGDSGTGKTCLTLRFVHDKFEINSPPTMGGFFSTKTIIVDDQALNFQIWDTAGQERYHSMAPLYYRGAAAAIIVYDITSKSTFLGAKRWIEELRKKGPQNMVLAIAGNKSDLVDEREVFEQTGREFANEIGAIFTECSALNAENINSLFEIIGKQLPAAEEHRVLLEQNYLKRTPSQKQESEKSSICC